MSPLSRREFITAGVAAGAGLVIGFYLPHGSNGSRGDGGIIRVGKGRSLDLYILGFLATSSA